jgi:hypothetical protein
MWHIQFANSMSLAFTITTCSATRSSTRSVPSDWWISTRRNWCLRVLSVPVATIWTLYLSSKLPNVYFLYFLLSVTSFLAYRMCRLRRYNLYPRVRKADPEPLSSQMWMRVRRVSTLIRLFIFFTQVDVRLGSSFAPPPPPIWTTMRTSSRSTGRANFDF